MADTKLRRSIIRLAHEKPELRKDLLPLLKEGKEKKAALVSRQDVAKLKKLVGDATNLADQISGSLDESANSYWYWNDIYQTLATVSDSVFSGRPMPM